MRLPVAACGLALALTAIAAIFTTPARAADKLAAATFQLDVTPPLGSPLCDALVVPGVAVDDPLTARGLVLVPVDQKAIVLVAVDWVGIGNDGNVQWRTSIANAVGTTPDRVAVHTLHQHDAPGCDFDSERIAAEHGLSGKIFDPKFAHDAIARAADAARDALQKLEPVTHVGAGQAKVEKVASTRRCLGADGKVEYVRYTACRDPKWQAYPEGNIDPYMKAISFYNGDKPLAILTYYATHPQSYYGKGRISIDFPGMGRDKFAAETPGPAHIHFNGAGGNVAAGKYNDGSPPMRDVLAGRMAAGMAGAYQATERFPVADAEINWDTREVALPPAAHLEKASLLTMIDNKDEILRNRIQAARGLAWLECYNEGRTITVSRLRLGKVDLIHMPGELFVEYQLEAQKMRPDSTVCMAAYGDYGPGYIGLSQSYAEGGYETTHWASRVAPGAEPVLMNALAELLK